MDIKKKQIISTLYPEFAGAVKQQETNDLLKTLIENMQEMKETKIIPVLKGDKGDDGYSPIKNVDYFDGYTPVKGVDYFDGEKGEDGKDADEKVIEERVFSKVIELIPPPVQGLPGRDGAEITKEQLVEKINLIEGEIDPKVIKGYETSDDVIKKIKKDKLDMRDIKGMPLNFNDQRWHGSGIPSLTAGTGISITDTTGGGKTISATGGGSYAILTATGTIDDSNLDFTFLSLPTELVINGGSYIQTI